jgi:hypothetical protein
MTSLRFTLLASLVLALGGCGALAQRVAEARYECHSPDRPNGEIRHASIRRAADGRSLLLSVDRQPSDVLQPLGQNRDDVYAGSAYAWRQHDRVGTLTDIAAVETFDCRRAAGIFAL